MFNDRFNPPGTPFPTLCVDSPDPWSWPAPPFRWDHVGPSGSEIAQPCRLETAAGEVGRGEMVRFDPAAGRLGFRSGSGRREVDVPFARIRRLTLTDPLQAAPPAAGAIPARLQMAVHERRYELHPHADGTPPLVGQTTGHVETDAGMYLFAPVAEETALQRVFVPRWAYARAEFGATASEVAARLWIADRPSLLQAIERQARMPVRPVGESVLALGLLTPLQLERVLGQPDDRMPLGERLVHLGLIDRAELQTVLAHKMGYPLVDLSRFPVDPEAAERLPRSIAAQTRMVPLLFDQGRLIVAVDALSRLAELRSLSAYAATPIVPALSTPFQIMLALRSNDIWVGRVSDRAGVRATS